MPDADNALRDLALRLLATSYPGASLPAELHLLVGRIPDGLPVALPVPERAQVAGTYVHGPKDIIVLLDTDLPPERVFAFYEERLRDAGWARLAAPDLLSISGGFTEPTRPLSPVSPRQALFCQGPHGPSLRVQAAAPPGEVLTQVRLDLDLLLGQPMCQPIQEGRQIVPSLTPPLHARQMTRSASLGAREFYVRAILESDGTLTDLVTHYAAQMEQAGWSQTEAGRGGSIAWSTWTWDGGQDGMWHAFFYATQHQEGIGVV